MKQKVIIIGSGRATAQLSVSLRQQGWADDILVVSAVSPGFYIKKRQKLSHSHDSGNSQSVISRETKPPTDQLAESVVAVNNLKGASS